jgi:hypothetical protein
LSNKNCEHADAASVNVRHPTEIQYNSTMASKHTRDALPKPASCRAVDDVPAAGDDCRVAFHDHL